MPFALDQVLPWGRSYDEYVAMFSLRRTDLRKRIAGCGDVPVSFNAEMHRRGLDAVSIDPVYQFDADAIRLRIDLAFDIALCSHLLFLYSRQLGLEFHLSSILEMRRIAAEVRIFPLVDLAVPVSRHRDDVVRELTARGLDTTIDEVEYEFRRGGTTILRVLAA